MVYSSCTFSYIASKSEIDFLKVQSDICLFWASGFQVLVVLQGRYLSMLDPNQQTITESPSGIVKSLRGGGGGGGGAYL